MNRVTAALGSFVFFFVAPGTVAGLIPWFISQWEMQAPFAGEAGRMVGVALIAGGLFQLIEAFGRFAWQGRGTPAPVLPTKHLVVTGAYRYVRNPMYLAVVAMCLGQALFFGDVRLVGYAALIWLGFHAFVTGYEEPTLVEQFGAQYEAYRRGVGRWIPRLTPWRANA